MSGWANPEQRSRKGPWTTEEDKSLSEYVNFYGEGRWSSVAKGSGLNRSGKSCRLRWVNYLMPGLKKCQLTPQEEGIIIELHGLLGNRWSTIARHLPGRTDNDIKNYWRTRFKNREREKQEKGKTQLMNLKWQTFQQLNQAQSVEKILQDESKLQEGKQLQEMPLIYKPTTMGDYQGLTSPTMSYNDASCVDSLMEDIGIWGGGLWDLLDHDDQSHVDFTTNS